MNRLTLPEVIRVQDGPSSTVEPPLNPEWSEAEKLAWHAATIALDTGLSIVLHDGAHTVKGRPVPGYYGITVYSDTGAMTSSASAFPYRDAWAYLNGISVGARARQSR